MQILHPFAGSIQQYCEAISDPDRYRPDHCPQCEAQQPPTAHGFYTRTVADVEFDGSIRVRRYLCHACKRTVSLLPDFALPYLRFSIFVISLFLVARLLNGCTLEAAAQALRLKCLVADCHLDSVGAAYAVAGRYEEALAPLQRYLSHHPNMLHIHLMLAVVYSELGQAAEARAEAAEVLRLNPQFSLEVHRQRMPIKDPAMLERQLVALRKAGLK